jgi:helix-turn-helix protein
MGSTNCAEDGSLGAELAATLEPDLQDALDHPLRREILRTLSGDARARSVVEIASRLSLPGSSEVNYHVLVLQRSGAVASEGPCLGPGGRQHAYRSEVAGDAQARKVLRATQGWDRERMRQSAAARSSHLLTMFRIPRPKRAIRIARRRPRPEPR